MKLISSILGLISSGFSRRSKAATPIPDPSPTPEATMFESVSEADLPQLHYLKSTPAKARQQCRKIRRAMKRG